MKGWKRYSLYHVMLKRVKNRFIAKTKTDFLSGISKQENLGEGVATISLIIFLITFVNVGITASVLVSLSSFLLMSLVIAIVDTRYMYNYRVRQQTIKSVKRILGIDDDGWIRR